MEYRGYYASQQESTYKSRPRPVILREILVNYFEQFILQTTERLRKICHGQATISYHLNISTDDAIIILICKQHI